VRMDRNASLSEEGDVSVVKVSIVEEGDSLSRVVLMLCRDSARRARRATARFPWVAKMRAMPVPYVSFWSVMV
jgi:hypothetical protein